MKFDTYKETDKDLKNLSGVVGNLVWGQSRVSAIEALRATYFALTSDSIHCFLITIVKSVMASIEDSEQEIEYQIVLILEALND